MIRTFKICTVCGSSTRRWCSEGYVCYGCIGVFTNPELGVRGQR